VPRNRKQVRKPKSPDRSPNALRNVQEVFNDALRHHQAGRFDEAVARYRRVLFLNPDFAEACNGLGAALATQGSFLQATTYFERALVLNPDNANAHSNLGIALVALGRIDEALGHFERALALNPNHAGAHTNLSLALVTRGRIDEPVAHSQRALALQPGHADIHLNLGLALAEQGRSDDAITHYERALAIKPDHAAARASIGDIFKYQGKFGDAVAQYDRAIAIRPAFAEAHLNRAEIKTFHQGDADLAALEALAGRGDLPADKAPLVHFALAKALEDCEDYPRAFEHMRKGNDLKRPQIKYDEPNVIELFKRISTVFNSSLFDRFQGEGDSSSVPIFVLGMPRSGSTLIEQILSSHPRIHGAGEVNYLDTAARTVLETNGQLVPYPEYVPLLDGVTLRRTGQYYLAGLPALVEGKVRIIDKMPGNFLKLGFIRLILPNARIIHTMRDPVDTCVSCYSRLFSSGQHFSYDLAELGRYYRGYTDLMTHWRSVLPPGAILDVSYEDVVNDLEGQARRLIDYCGLPWNDRCLEFHRNSRPVKTASTAQIRRPLFRSSLQRWRKYEAGIGPLLLELRDIIPGHASARARGTVGSSASAAHC
jgi:tetratricopeptide (TPR) repeat protein